MVTYVYKVLRSDHIQEYFEIQQSIFDDALTEDPETGLPVERVPQIPYIIMDASKPKTIDALAARNTEQMRKEGKLPNKKQEERPWWRPNKSKPVDIKGKTVQQLNRYIYEGK